MGPTYTLDAKDLPLPGTRITDDGHRHIDLDALFHEELRTEERTIDGLPGTRVKVRPMSRLMLAGNRREHDSRTMGKTVTLHDFFTFQGWDKNNYGYVQGQPAQGPHMKATKLPTVISAADGVEEVGLVVEDGDTVVFMGTEFRVTFPPHANRNMTLIPVPESAVAA